VSFSTPIYPPRFNSPTTLTKTRSIVTFTRFQTATYSTTFIMVDLPRWFGSPAG